MSDVVKCEKCERERTEEDGDYNFLQAVFNTPFGWYSGDDGEFCGPCLRDLMTLGNQ